MVRRREKRALERKRENKLYFFTLFLFFFPGPPSLRGRKRSRDCKPLVTTCFVVVVVVVKNKIATSNAHQHAYCCCHLRLSTKKMESLRTEAHNCSCLLLLFKILNNKTNKPQNALKKKRISIQPSHRTFFSSTRTIPPHVNVCTKTTAHRVERKQ
jgi:hypothetical protein